LCKDANMAKLIHETKRDYYDQNDIKSKFIDYRSIKHSQITDDEFDFFCGELWYLPKEIVDRVKDEVCFLLLGGNNDSLAEQNIAEAFYLSLKTGIPESTEAIIVITASIFKSKRQRAILHEIAHHILGFSSYSDAADKLIVEKKTDDQVSEWMKKREG
jgi:hypothetical protein